MLLRTKRERTLALVGSNPTPTAKKCREQEVDQQVSPAFPVLPKESCSDHLADEFMTALKKSEPAI
jgi:hypothetical protein